ncbi:MAG: hypothetical protein JRD89_17585 [Deltaproteobacteria bacterium]|nr:hypothetical protein [Deltaproteobacteria bacterium]
MGVSWVLQRHRDGIAEGIEAILSMIGEERIRILVEDGITLVSLWPNKDQLLSKVADYAAPYQDFIGRIDLGEVASWLTDLLDETNSPFAFIPQSWILKNLREARREILATMVK